MSAFVEPKTTVGTEVIRRQSNYKQVMFLLGATAKTIYGRLFLWIVQRCNQSLNQRSKKRQQQASTRTRYIGVLDIAGFEILGVNSFEQL